MSRVCVAVVCLLLIASTSQPSSVITESDFVPQFNPTLKAHRVNGEIKIDGQLNDAGWRGALPAGNFTEHSPGDEIAPPVRTEAFVAYDEDNLYLAAVCYADSSKVRASMCERERIFDDDNIGFFFDPYGDATRAYIININPHGIPYDALWSASYGEDDNFDLMFESRGIVTDSGYQVELAIPFSSLRFPNKPVQQWRFDFYRHHLREVHYSMSWATYDQNQSCWPCQWGTVTGIENVKPGKGLELLPSFVAHQSGSVADATFPDTSFANGDIYGDLSIGGKYAVSSNVVVEGAYNPDFSQIEADASQVDVNTTYALQYEEKRPFFQEGMDLFLTYFNAVYTRSINNPDYAAKASARFGRTAFAALSAHDEQSLSILPFEEHSSYVPLSKTLTNMFSLRQSIGASSYIRGLMTDQRVDGGGSGTLSSFDTKLHLNKSVSLRGQFMATHTEEPDDTSMTSHLEDGATFDDGKHTVAFDGESYWGIGALAGVMYNVKNFYAYSRVYERTPTYRAANGFQPRNNDRRWMTEAEYTIRPSGTIFSSIEPGVDFARIWNFDGLRKDEWIRFDCETQLRFAQGSFWAEYLLSRERLGGIDFRDIRVFTISAQACPVRLVEGGWTLSYGNMIARNYLRMGRETNVNAWLKLRPTDRVLAEVDFTYNKSHDVETREKFFEGHILWTRLGYQFNRELSFRLVTEYNGFGDRWSVDPLITYRINPFSTFYAGATYDYDKYLDCGVTNDRTMTCLSQRQFFIKIQYLFQT
ncbi:MAG: sugar-binding protein [Candidatus Zixiibacteriota bacterium]